MRKLDYRWHLRELMALQGMFSTTDLRPMLAERGVILSASQTYRLVTEKPERLSLKTLVALLDILGCHMEDLIEPFAAGNRSRAQKAVGKGQQSATGVGLHRPKRARIVPN
ncbi:XRE family transcriptional regulator [Mycobacteroides chelonae]|uniref:helix-turn-helix domain-containing protein n=1 Tax=Mycobacteroides chelonae TaxID=1774 RepID=UPI0008A97C18|nr:helix-turn-helix transcriptional regulator [Mycobacteroides chelonae]OHT78144.1 XRE family transcriptional regulator [Mycobacteroides chelonae]